MAARLNQNQQDFEARFDALLASKREADVDLGEAGVLSDVDLLSSNNRICYSIRNLKHAFKSCSSHAVSIQRLRRHAAGCCSLTARIVRQDLSPVGCHTARLF